MKLAAVKDLGWPISLRLRERKTRDREGQETAKKNQLQPSESAIELSEPTQYMRSSVKMYAPEQELAVQVTQVDSVHINNVNVFEA